MSIKIGNYTFNGPYTSTANLEDRSGVYAILCQKEGKNYVVDVGESATVKSRVDSHDREDCWKRNCNGTLAMAVYYTPNLQQPGSNNDPRLMLGTICCGCLEI
jgi:hypothetical protein